MGRVPKLIALVAPMALLASCGKGADQVVAPAVPVEVATAQVQTTPLYSEYVGDIRAVEDVGVFPRVGGILTQQAFTDGTMVRKGQLLFVIDPREYHAAVAGAQAQLAVAQAQAARAQQDVARYQPLIAEDAISRQVYDNSIATARASTAQVQAANANLTQARLGLSYAYVRAPISGRIGKAAVDVGTLVAPGSTELARVSNASMVYVYFSASEQEVLRFEHLPPEQRDQSQKGLRLTLADGSTYPLPGTIDFTDRAIDSVTGSFKVRARFPNPDLSLKPGQFGRVQVQVAVRANAIVIPDKAVIEQFGSYFVMVVGAGNKVEQRQVQVGPHVGGSWVIDEGLKAGERVIVEGLARAKPGAVVQPTTPVAPKS